MTNFKHQVEGFDKPIQITYDKVVEDKIVIDCRAKKLVIEYRIGSFDEDDNFITAESHTIVSRDDDFDSMTSRLFDNEQLFFSKVRSDAKSDIEKKHKKLGQKHKKLSQKEK